ncbi:MAG: branched-chain amino acid ABC transporter substrate-binding protein [Candidatus Nanopelagicales bacterium]
MRNAYKIGAIALAGSLALAACGSSSSSTTGSSGGTGGKTVVVSTDLPLQGSSKDASDATNQAIELYLEQIGYKAGDYTIELKKYDDSTAAAGKWDQAQCTKNGTDHVANANEVAVMGTYNSGCAKIMVPILNQDPNGPMLMVSQANTNPGLTKTWDPGEPEKYYPTGVRNYARVVTTDDNQGRAAAQFMAKDLGVKTCYILNDNETYGQGVASAFEAEAKKQGINVLGNDPWDAKQPNYTALFQKIKAGNPDCIYLGGIFDNNGGQLIKDKVAVLGDNQAVKLMGPDGFTGYPELNKLPQGQGMYLSFPGLTNDDLRAQGGAAAKLLDAYKAKYGSDPASSYALYGVAAMQVILEAIKKSDGTRKSITEQVVGGSNQITVPADISAIGKEIKIDPATGDVNLLDMTIEVIKDNAETTLKGWPIQE